MAGIEPGSGVNSGVLELSASKDLTGVKFGRLSVVERMLTTLNGKVRWRCVCDCGGEAVVCGRHLRSGHTQSCGCLKRERTAEAKLKDIAGRRFGRLVVVDRAPNSRLGEARWRCACDCGGETVVCGYNLRSGITQSCGCLQRTHLQSNSPEFRAWTGAK